MRRSASAYAVLVAVVVAGCAACGESRPAGNQVARPAIGSAFSSAHPGVPATSAASVSRPPTRRARTVAPRPPIVVRPIPFGARRKAEMGAYARRHYGSLLAPTYRLVHPQVIVEHFTETATFQQAYNTFAPDQPDSELHELPGTCAHFVIDRDGTIYQLVSTAIMCRHTVGLNWTAIGIEHVAFSDRQVLSDRRQMRASLALTCWLRSRLNIKVQNVIGHNESLASPLHREDVAQLRGQTHNDLARPAMRIYRARLKRACPSP